MGVLVKWDPEKEQKPTGSKEAGYNRPWRATRSLFFNLLVTFLAEIDDHPEGGKELKVAEGNLLNSLW